MKWLKTKRQKANIKKAIKSYENKLKRKLNFEEIKINFFVRKEGIVNWKYLEYIYKNPDCATFSQMLCCYTNAMFYTGKKSSNSNIEYLTLIYGKKKAKEMIKRHSDNIRGKKNPGYNHGGLYSPFSKKFIKGDISKETFEKVRKTIKENPQNRPTRIEYYLEKTNGDIDKATQLYKKRQTTFSKDLCIERYGEKIGIEIWKKRQEKWMMSFKKSNFSNISQELFWSIVDHIGVEGVQFAQLKDGKSYFGGENKEKIIHTQKSFIKADFVLGNKIIEFDGDYWHGKDKNKKRDMERDAAIIEAGYKIIHIKEYLYKENKEREIKRCLEFLDE